MDKNAQAEVPECLAVPGLGVIMLRDWEKEGEAAYLASIAAEYERLGMGVPDDCIVTDSDN